LTDKELIDKKLEKFTVNAVVKSLVLLKGFKEGRIRAAFHRGSISLEMAIALEEVTTIHMAFWQAPSLYDQKGNRKPKRN
jgi:hypothetical protein